MEKRLRDDNGGVLVAVDGDVSRFELESKRVRSEEPLSRRDECPKRREEARSFDVCSALPLDVAWLLAGFLDPRSLFRCCLVSLAWLDIFGSDAVWRAQFSSVFPCRSGFARRLEGPRVMSLFAVRCRLETLFSPRSFDCGALARRGAEACEVGRETIEQVMRLAEAEGRLRCVECCSSMEFLPRVAAAVAEQARWRDRSARAVAGSTEFVRSLMSSVRFWKSERRESRFFPAGPDFSQEFLFSFSLRGILYTCAFFESDSEDDRDFPQFTVTNAVTLASVSWTLYPLDLWIDEYDLHPLRLFESARLFLGIAVEEAVDMLEFLLLAVKRERFLGNRRAIVYADIQCEECGQIHQ